MLPPAPPPLCPMPACRVRHYEGLCPSLHATVLPAVEPLRQGFVGREIAQQLAAGEWLAVGGCLCV